MQVVTLPYCHLTLPYRVMQHATSRTNHTAHVEHNRRLQRQQLHTSSIENGSTQVQIAELTSCLPVPRPARLLEAAIRSPPHSCCTCRIHCHPAARSGRNCTVPIAHMSAAPQVATLLAPLSLEHVGQGYGRTFGPLMLVSDDMKHMASLGCFLSLIHTTSTLLLPAVLL